MHNLKSERERERQRQTDRHTDRQKDRETESDRQTVCLMAGERQIITIGF